MIEYTEQLAEKIAERIANGESMRYIAKDEGLPSMSTLMRWMEKYPDFESKCARARLMQAELMDEMIMAAAEETDPDNFQAMKVKISAYQWRASKLSPKKYGDKIQQEITGSIKSILVPERIATERSKSDVEPDFEG